MVNWMGLIYFYEFVEEEGVLFGDIVVVFVIVEVLFDVQGFWMMIDVVDFGEGVWLLLFEQVVVELCVVMVDLLWGLVVGWLVGDMIKVLMLGIVKFDVSVDMLLFDEICI